MRVTMKSALTAMAVMFISAVWSQNVSVRNGASFKIGNFEYVENVLSVNRDGSSTVLMKAGFFGNKFRVLNLNKDLGEDSKFEVEIPKVDNRKVKYLSSGQYGDHVYFFSTYKDRKAKTIQLFASEMDPKNGKFIKHHNPAKLNYDKMFTLGNRFEMKRSVDSSKILFIAKYPVSLKEPAKYKMTVCNNDMSVVWEKDIDFSIAANSLVYDGALVDKYGNVHLLVTEKMSKEEAKEEGKGLFADKWRAELYSFYHESGKLVHYDLEKNLSDKVVQNIHLTTNDAGEVIGVGFYSDRKFWGQGYSGFYSLRIDPKTQEIVSANASPFSEELKADLIGARKASKGKDIPKYMVRDVIPLDNGKMGVVTEHYVYTKRTSDDTEYESWLFGNVMVLFLDEDGKMESSGVLKKKQYCTAKDGKASLFQKLGIGAYPGVNELPYYGIAIMEVNNNIHIIFNDNPKNPVRIQDGKKPKSVRQRNAITELVTFTPDGKMMRNTLFKAKDIDAGYKMPIMPRQSTQYSANEMIIFGRKKKNFRVLGITIQ